MNVSKEELLHIAKLANLNLKDEELDNYLSLPKRGAVSMKQYRYSALIVGEDGIFLL